MDRSTTIIINGKEYELLLTTKAFEAISKKYGGIENLGDKIIEEKSLSEIIYLVVLLANQSILRYNFEHKDAPKDLLTEDEVELWTTPLDFADYQSAIASALRKGMARNIQSEEQPSKNVEVG